MGKIVVKDQPCLSEDCGSSDARQVYEDGTSYCFSCTGWFPDQNKDLFVSIKKESYGTETLEEIASYAVRGFADRKITKKITEYFNVRVTVNEKGELDYTIIHMVLVKLQDIRNGISLKSSQLLEKLKAFLAKCKQAMGGNS